MQTKRTTEPKVMTFRSFQISMCILFLSNQFGRTFCLLLLVDLAKRTKTGGHSAQMTNFIKNLRLLEVRNLLMQCYTTQYCYTFGCFDCVDLDKLCEIIKNASQTYDRAKSYDICKFPNFYAHFMLVQSRRPLVFSIASCRSLNNQRKLVVTVLK